MTVSTYKGKICEKHPEHKGSRYSSSYKCTQCCKERDKVKYANNREAHNEKSRVYYEKNKEQCRAKQKEYKIAHIEEFKARDKKYVENNYEKISAYKKEWNVLNVDRLKESRKAYYKAYRVENKERVAGFKKAWQKRNPGNGIAILASRRAKKLQATPAWANKFFIEEAYHLAKLREKVCGGKWHVDHIVPLKSKLVCGLHVEYNLRVIPASDNQTKGNRYWPDMPV